MTPVEPTGNCIGYVRVSEVAGRDDAVFRSPDLQRAAIERSAASTRMMVSRWFQDLDVTGTTQRRPGLDEARALAKATGWPILVYELSRWARSVENGLADINALADAGVEVLSATERIDLSTGAGRFSLTVLLAVHELVVAQRSEGWRSVYERNRDHGRWHGVAPYGYRRLTKDELLTVTAEDAEALGISLELLRDPVGLLVPDRGHAEIVREAFEDRASGTTGAEIARSMIERGVFRRKQSTYEMLRNPVYVGLVPRVKSRRRAFGTAEGFEGKPLLDTHLRHRWKYEHEYVRGIHCPLVDEKTWDAVRALDKREQAGRRGRRTANASWWGVGVTRCAGCGRAVTRMVKELPSGTFEYVRCPTTRKDGLCEGIGSARIDEIEAEILPALAELADGLDLDLAHRTKAKASKAAPDGLAEARREVKSKEQALARAVSEGIRNHLSEDVMTMALAPLKSDLAAAQAHLATLEASPALSETVVAQVRALSETWADLTANERRRVLRALGLEVLVLPKHTAGRQREPLDGRVVLRAPEALRPRA